MFLQDEKKIVFCSFFENLLFRCFPRMCCVALLPIYLKVFALFEGKKHIFAFIVVNSNISCSAPSIVDLSGAQSSSPFQQYLQRRAEESELSQKAANLSKQIAQFKLSRNDNVPADPTYVPASLQLVGRVSVPSGSGSGSKRVVLCVDDLLKLHEKLVA